MRALQMFRRPPRIVEDFAADIGEKFIAWRATNSVFGNICSYPFRSAEEFMRIERESIDIKSQVEVKSDGWTPSLQNQKLIDSSSDSRTEPT